MCSHPLRHGAQGTYDEASNGLKESDFGTKNDDEVIEKILLGGELQESKVSSLSRHVPSSSRTTESKADKMFSVISSLSVRVPRTMPRAPWLHTKLGALHHVIGYPFGLSMPRPHWNETGRKVVFINWRFVL